MSDGFEVVAEQLRAHAGNVRAAQDGFAAVKAASTHITQDDRAYGLLCSWMPGCLEARHTRQDQLFADVEENLSLVAQRLRQTADLYDEADRWGADRLDGMTSDVWEGVQGAPR